MKKLLLLIPIIIACAKPIYYHECAQDMFGNCEADTITYRSEKQAYRYANRFEKHCTRPERINDKLVLERQHIECFRRIINKDFGLITKKQRQQLKRD